MDSIVLDRFERQMDALLKHFGRLKRENVLLRTKQNTLLSEKNVLLNKTNMTIRTIQAMVERLKSIEDVE